MKSLSVKQVNKLIQKRLGMNYRVVKIGSGNFQQWDLRQFDNHSEETIITKYSAQDLLFEIGIENPNKYTGFKL